MEEITSKEIEMKTFTLVDANKLIIQQPWTAQEFGSALAQLSTQVKFTDAAVGVLQSFLVGIMGLKK